MKGAAPQTRIWSAVLLTSLGWGTSLVVTRIALREGIAPLTIVGVTSAIAAAAVVLFLLFSRGGPSIGRIEVTMGVVMSILSVTLPFVSRSMALQYASAGFVGLASALVPLATVVLANFFLKDEPLKLATVAGLGVALIGVAVLIFSGDSGIGAAGRPALAGGLALVGVVSVALGAVYAKRYAGDYSVLGVAGIQFAIGAVLAFGASVMVHGIPAGLSGAGWLSLLYIGLAGTFLPIVLFYWLLRHVTVTYTTVIGYLVPLVAVVVGVVVLGEELQAGLIVGGILILAGVIVTDRLRMRAIRQGTDA